MFSQLNKATAQGAEVESECRGDVGKTANNARTQKLEGGVLGMSDDPLEEWRKANKEYFGNSTYKDRKKRFHEWMVSMWKAGHMPVEIRDIWVHDYIGRDEGDEPPA